MANGHGEQKRGSRLGLLIKRIIFLVLPVLVLAGGFAGYIAMGAWKPVPEEKEDIVEALPVLTAQAVSEPVQLRVMSQGEVVARSEVNLAAEISGRLAYVSPAFLPGGSFSKNDVLFRLEDRELKLRVVQAEATVAQARTAFIREVSEADLAEADARDLGVEAISDLGLRRPQLAEAQAMLASAQAAYDESQLQLERAVIRAPFDGRVRTKLVDIGAYVTPGMELGAIYASDIVDVPIPLADKDLAALGLGIGFVETRDNPGPEVTLSATIADVPHSWTGRITRTDSGFDPSTRVLFAYVTVEDPYGTGADDGMPLATGLFVSAEMMGRQLVDSIVVPRTALRGTESVYVARADDILEIRPVEVASSDRTRAVIIRGLSVGEDVITSPVRGAADGMKIKPVERMDAVASIDDEEPVAAVAQTISQ